ncbi:amidohydrolase family protein [Xylophilus sp. GOD-11R]|uniref:metal-dependent hydrolase family protein n=1 Tax=Xylophilus sp. GOD-11R TaxID=3089814 RepID=UPI00298C6503|nr:amidohydrolase family protein [Xylophilus sp. GOD-11R]WPB58935.1 amidohydrolase family protein [Xylophilus sp. GOD-11R]
MSVYVFRHADVLDLDAGSLVRNVDVVVGNESIVSMGQGLPVPADAQGVYDATGLTLMPGLIDCHVHATASTVNLGVSAKMPNALSVIRALPILKGMLSRGFTSVRDAGGSDWALSSASKDWLIDAPRIFPSGKALSQTGGHGDFRQRGDQLEACSCSYRIGDIGRVVDGVDEVRRAARDELTRGATQIKVMASGGVTSPNDPIGNTGYSMDELKAIVAEAEAWQTYVMAHAYTPRAIRRAVEAGVRTIEHGNLIDEETAQLLREKNVFVVPTLITFDMLAVEGEKFGLPPESIAKVDDVRLQGRAAIAMLHRVGVKMGFGSDLLGESHRHQSAELQVRAEIVGNLESIRSATTVAAEILMRAGQLGVIRPGATADILLVRGNPLEDIGVLTGQGEGLAAIMKDGRFFKNELIQLAGVAVAS